MQGFVRSLMVKLTMLGVLALSVGITPLFVNASSPVISDFESGTLEGWNNGAIVTGFNSAGALRLSNGANDSTGTTKNVNAPILRGYQTLEMDINLNGNTILDGDAAAVVFDQGGWRLTSLKNYVQNGVNGWQHIAIPSSAFPGLNIESGIASMTIRFWNYKAGSYDIDNIILSTSTTPPPPPTQTGTIADFQNGMDGFNSGTLTSGFLRLSNNPNADASARKTINSAVLKGYKTLELDLNLNGSTILDGDAGAVFLDQGGQKISSLKKYLSNNGVSGWQHLKIPLTDFAGLNTDNGIASISFRFWNYKSGNYDLDNIALTNDSVIPPVPTLETPSSLSGSYSTNQINLAWAGSGPTYIIYKNNSEIARMTAKSYSDTAVAAGMTYSYFIKATDGSTVTPSSNSISVAVPANPVTPSGWVAKSIDSQVMSKYWAVSDSNQIRHLVEADKSIGAKQIAVSINFDNYALLKLWADTIHSEGLNVWFRSHWNDWDSWEKENIKSGITNTEYLNRTKQFILSHPDLFRAGDAFTMCVESENAAWWTGIDNGPFTGWESWRAFTRNQVIYSNDAFTQIGLGGKVITNWINMNGWVAWNVMDKYTANTVGQLTLDHIIDWTDDTATYTNALFHGDGNGFYGYDDYYNKWHVPMMAGEWGYSTYNQTIDSNHQKELSAAVFSEFAKRNYIVGVNYWIDVGHASRLFDTTNLLDYNRRPVADVVEQYYN